MRIGCFGNFTRAWRDRLAARKARFVSSEDHPDLQSEEREPIRRQFRYDEDARRKQLMERIRRQKRHRRKYRRKSQAKERHQVRTSNPELADIEGYLYKGERPPWK